MKSISIDEIIVNGFKNKDKTVSIAFSDGCTTNIYGPNGYGKTTLLNIIYALFDKNEDALILENVESIEIIYSTLNEIQKVNVYRDRNNTSTNYNWTAFKESELSSLKILYITTERGLSSSRRKLNQEDINIFFNQNSNLNLNLNSSYKDIDRLLNFLNGKSEEIILEDIKKDSNVFIQNVNMSVLENIMLSIENESKKNRYIQQMNIKNKLLIKTLEMYKTLNESDVQSKTSNSDTEQEYSLNEEEKTVLKDIAKESYDLITNCIEFSYKHNTEFFNDVKVSIEKYESIKDTKSKIKEYFYSIVNKEIIISGDKVLVRVDNETHTLDKLSHGERQLITFLVFLDYVGKNKDLILIDEPCISLDTDWQEKLVSIFSQLCPRSKFILTSHSPYLSVNYVDSIRNISIRE